MTTPPVRPQVSVGLLLFAVVLLSINLRSPIIAIGPVVGFIRDDLGVSGSFMGLVGALPMLAFALFSPLAARFARRFGMENVLVGSIVLLSAGIVLRSALPSPALLVIGTVVLSAAIAMGNVLLPALAKRNLPKRIGLVVGTLSATMSVSAALAAIIAVPMAQWQNWQWPLGIWILTALPALAVWLYIRMANGETATRSQPVSDGLNVWQSRAAWCISVFMGIQSLSFYAMVNFLPSVLIEKGMTPLTAGACVSLFQASSLIGVLAASFWFGRSNKKQLFNLTSAVFMFAGIAGLWLGSTPTMWLWAALTGIGGSAAFSISLMLFALRTDNTYEAASLSGMAQTVGYSIAIIGPLGMGVLYDWLGSWSVSMTALTVLMFV
ncbi:MFS transporter [Neisseria sp. MVDL20-010259]|uniref:MFS transporter n=2 Tax=Neisseria TaxID=482 RepID=UPI00265F2B70|nr:MFS transporter [Neisseria sp. MVDL20-010259]MDO1563839.1 MFS transporter [Neisseria sp. MVDL20-010259]